MRFAGDLTTYGTVEAQPRLEGRNAHILISPTKSTTTGKAEKPEKPEKAEKPKPPQPPVA
jgi:translation initiation factor IF-3